MFKKANKLAQESKVRSRFLDSKFQEISDVDLIKELNKRVKYKPTIKLSMYTGNQTVFIEGKDIKCGTGIALPIEIKTKD